jgi:hypothetical protein
VPTPGETDAESRARVLDDALAHRLGLTGEQILATRSAGATATRGAMGGLRSLPEPAPGGPSGAVAFADARHGWIAAGSGGGGQPQALLATTDGGRRWAKLRDLDFVAYDLDFVSPAMLLETRDGGRTWAQTYPPDGAAYAGVPACRAADVQAVHAGWSGADDASASITVRSNGTRPCVLQGRPTVELLDAAGAVLPHAPAPAPRDPGPAVLVQPEQRAHLSLIWRTRCHEKPAGPVMVRLWLPGESPAAGAPVVPEHAGTLELQQTPEPLRLRCEAATGPPRLDAGSFIALDPPVTP